MTDNIFTERFNKKENDELEAIALNETVYTDEARLTALDLLKSRDALTTDLSEIYQTLQAKAVERQNISKTFEGANTVDNTFDESKLPELHSKQLILMFSIFFSTIFGGALLMYNFKKVGQFKARNLVLLFCILYAFVPVALMSLFNFSSNVSIIVNILGGFILTEYFWNTYLGKSILYRKRNWVKPTLIALAIAIPMVILVLLSGGVPQLD
ncbi:hypothetical protein [Formosa sp. S-31]|uniref:hypothetical protein n=1 Tax=Formosa sp. S-31 TaxID=2790949 RepID=UPI003EBE3671